ncbi:uncharacterized protein LOC135804789 [Sycon ciliatum]|uniref:uncharacterized protein LOC135804789 n=1 Tax=Sycon ciliatum TaxID=27933 RepID=UPI0020ABCE7E|eukprot:scpid60454/ scgid25226/ 
MELKCQCLNVTICVQQSTFGRTIDLESLRQENQDDPFNGCCLKEMDLDVPGISMEQSSLVSERLYGDLQVFKCHGCAMVTHCSHQHKPGRLLVNSELLSDPSKISELRQSSSFSQVFSVVLPPDFDSSFPDVVHLQKNLGPSAVAQAQQVLDSYVMAEEASVQARIQAFIDQQNLVLTRIKQKAQQDLRSLYNVMSSIPATQHRESKTEAVSTKYTVSADRPENMSTVYSGEHSFSRPATHDTGVFCMDDLDMMTHGDRSAFLSDDDDEDDDPSTDNSFQGSQVGLAMAGAASRSTIPQHTDNDGTWILGKSAPVQMPGRPARFTSGGAVRDDGLTPSFEDIGNSIKAIAQSVQDQSTLLFGELPRPRTATSFIDTVS